MAGAPPGTAGWRRIDPMDAGPFLQQYWLSDAEYVSGESMLGFDPISSATMARTPVPAYTTRLLAIGLPFRIDIRVGADFYHDSDDNIVTTPFRLPPYSLEGRSSNTLSSWDRFRARFQSAMEYQVENMEGLASGLSFVAINWMSFTFIGSNNMEAFRARLRGGCGIKLPASLHTKGVLSIMNRDDQCLRCCIMCLVMGIAGDHSYRWSNYITNAPRNGRFPANFVPIYKECPGIDFSMLPVDRPSDEDDISAFEEKNEDITISTFVWKQCGHGGLIQEFARPHRSPPPHRRNRPLQLFLLHFNGHYCVIKDFQRFTCQQKSAISSTNTGSHDTFFTCYKCMEPIRACKDIAKKPEDRRPVDTYFKAHLAKCEGDGVEKPPQSTRLPSEKNPKDKKIVMFRNSKNTFMSPLIVYSDLETFHTPAKDLAGRPIAGAPFENRHIASAGLHAVGIGFEVPPQFQAQIYAAMTENDDVFVPYMQYLIRLALYWRQKREDQEAIAMTMEAWHSYNNQHTCEHCHLEFTPKDAKLPKGVQRVKKCRDHDHLTGAYRGALCSSCNCKAQQPTTIPIASHNSIGFDNHFYVRGLARIQNGKLGQLTPSELIGMPKLDKEKPLKDWKINCIANSSEKLKCITFSGGGLSFRWIDTCAFMKNSLAKLIKMQTEAFTHKIAGVQIIDYDSAFPNMLRFHPYVKGSEVSPAHRFKLLLKKIRFPYNGLTGPGVWSEEALLPVAAYHDDFAKKPISPEELLEVKEIIEECCMACFRDYHDCYLHTDVLTTADIFEAFRKNFHTNFGIDPAHYLGVPGAALDAMLLKSQAVVHNITEECAGGRGVQLMGDLNPNIRGGLSVMFAAHVEAWNPHVPGYDPLLDRPMSWICGFDATSLYPAAMSMALPVGDYQFVDLESKPPNDRMAVFYDMLDEYTPESRRGAMIVCTFKVPKEMHNMFDYAPAVNRSIDISELTERQQQVKIRKFLKAHLHGEGGDYEQKLAAFQQQPEADRVALVLKLLERNCRDSGKKLVPDLGLRTQGIHIAYAKLLLELGVEFVSIDRIWTFEQRFCFREFIQGIAKQKGTTENEALREILKIILNSLFGKMIENKERYRDIRLHTQTNKFQKAGNSKFCEHAFMQDLEKDIDGKITSFLGLTSHKKQKGVVLDSPRLIGWAILELSKMIMMKFHYKVMKPNFIYRLLMTDTDSLYYHIFSQIDPVLKCAELNAARGEFSVFDLSKHPDFPDCLNKGILGLFKLESASNPILEMVFLACKLYAAKHKFLIKDKENPKDPGRFDCLKGRGTPAPQLLRQFNFDSYFQCLYLNVAEQAKFRSFKSSNHNVLHVDTVRSALSADRDKTYEISAQTSRPLGHYMNGSGIDNVGFELEDITLGALKLALKIFRPPAAEPPPVAAEEQAPEPAPESDVESESEAAAGSASESSDIDSLYDCCESD